MRMRFPGDPDPFPDFKHIVVGWGFMLGLVILYAVIGTDVLWLLIALLGLLLFALVSVLLGGIVKAIMEIIKTFKECKHD